MNGAALRRESTLASGGARVRGTMALLRLYDREIVRYLHETLDLFGDVPRYEQACARRLESTLRWCRDIPFYAERFAEAGLFEGDVLHAERLEQVRPLTKDDIRRKFDALQHPQRQTGRYENTSGGSTGEPVRLMQDRCYAARSTADTLLFGVLNGKNPGEPEVKLWGSERDILEGSIGVREKLINRAFNRVLLNSFAMDDATMRGYIGVINDTRPAQIWAYVDSILELARFALQHQLRVHNPAVVVCTAGTMYPEMRSELEQCFPQSRIVNQYGSREVGQVACEVIGVSGMWLMRHSNHVELVDIESGAAIHEAGQPGRVLVTTLHNRTMPLVRFDIGDVAEFVAHEPGRHRAFATLHGRDNAHFLTMHGRRIHGEYFTHLFYGRDWLETFQVAQTAPARIEVRYVPAGERRPSPDQLNDIRAKIAAVMGAAVQVEFDARKEIGRLGSGKYQFVRREFA